MFVNSQRGRSVEAISFFVASCICAYALGGETTVERGIVYGHAGGQELLLDAYLPAAAESGAKRAAVVLIHGGGWQGGDRSAESCVKLSQALAEAGIAAFNIDYRLVKKSSDGASWVNQYPASIDDCRRAVRWVRSHADQYNLKTDKLGAAGDSAGGHLVSMLGTTDAPPESTEPGTPSSRVQAVVDIYGPTDLTRDFSKMVIGPIRVEDLVNAFVPTPESKKAASPLRAVDEKSAAFLIFHGTADPLVPVEQSKDMFAALQKAGRPAEYVEFPGAGHGFHGAEWNELVAKSVAFFKKELDGEGE